MSIVYLKLFKRESKVIPNPDKWEKVKCSGNPKFFKRMCRNQKDKAEGIINSAKAAAAGASGEMKKNMIKESFDKALDAVNEERSPLRPRYDHEMAVTEQAARPDGEAWDAHDGARHVIADVHTFTCFRTASGQAKEWETKVILCGIAMQLLLPLPEFLAGSAADFPTGLTGPLIFKQLLLALGYCLEFLLCLDFIWILLLVTSSSLPA